MASLLSPDIRGIHRKSTEIFRLGNPIMSSLLFPIDLMLKTATQTADVMQKSIERMASGTGNLPGLNPFAWMKLATDFMLAATAPPKPGPTPVPDPAPTVRRVPGWGP